ncbi:hypothetical protein FXO37_18547 [Capsicum annuum]|nr:hypothetical protein FXO37_18547 [Capsicum annuum]
MSSPQWLLHIIATMAIAYHRHKGYCISSPQGLSHIIATMAIAYHRHKGYCISSPQWPLHIIFAKAISYHRPRMNSISVDTLDRNAGVEDISSFHESAYECIEADEEWSIIRFFVQGRDAAYSESQIRNGTRNCKRTSIFQRFIKVGLWCIHPDPILRPSMKIVTQMLEGTITVGVPPLMNQ